MAFSKYRGERNYSLKVTPYKLLHDLILRQGVVLPPISGVQMRPKNAFRSDSCASPLSYLGPIFSEAK